MRVHFTYFKDLSKDYIVGSQTISEVAIKTILVDQARAQTGKVIKTEHINHLRQTNEGHSMSSSLEKLHRVLRRFGPSEQLLRETRLVLSSKIEDLLAKAKKLEEKRISTRYSLALPSERKFEKRKPEEPKREEIAFRRRLREKGPLFLRVAPPVPKIYIDTVVFLNVFKKEQPYVKSSERILRAVELGCLKGVSSNYSKVEIGLILKNKELCKIAFDQLNRWKVKIVDVTERVLLNLLIVRSLMHDVNDLIHASTALTDNVRALTTRNIRDFVGLQRYFLVWPPEKIIDEFNVEKCIAKKSETAHA